MRWGYIIPRAVLIAGLWAFFTFAVDPLAQRQMIGVGEKAVSAKVEIGAFQTKLFPPQASLSGVRVANRNKPGTNLVEFDGLVLNVAGGPLLKKLFIVDEGTLSGVRWGTPRDDSGLLPETADDEAQREAADNDGATGESTIACELKARGKQLLETLTGRAKREIDPQQFESVRLGIDMEQRWTAEYARLQTEATELTGQVEALERQIKSLSGKKLEQLEAYAQAAGDCTKTLDEVKQLKTQLEAQTKQAKQDFVALSKAQKRDRETLREKIDLFTTDPQQLTETLLGPELDHRLREAIGWIQNGRKWFQRRREEKPQRARGEQILFAREPNLPEFLIKLLHVDGSAQLSGQPVELAGTVTGLTSDPAVHGEPAILKLKGTGAADVDLEAVFDYTHPDAEPVHEVLLSYATSHPDPLNLGDDSSLAVCVTAEKQTCRAELRLVGDVLTGTIHLREEPAKLAAKLGGDAAELDSHLTSAVADIFEGISAVDAEMQIEGALPAPHWKITSTLGEEIAGGLKGALAKQLDGERQNLQKKFDEQIVAQKARLQELFKSQTKTLTTQLGKYEQQIQQLTQQATGGRMKNLENAAGKSLGKILKQSPESKNGVTPIDFAAEEKKAKEGLRKLLKK